jgi:hypothetical protein
MLKGLIVLLVIRLCRHCTYSDYCNLYYIISIRHFKYRFGTGIVALGIPVYYFLMDNKKNSEGTAGQSFLIPHVFNCNLCRE